jgi:predicted ATPase
MQITIENFGPIKHFVFDTEKDLTLIFGKNSVGKSYAISLVYLILKKIPVSQNNIDLVIKQINSSEHHDVNKPCTQEEAFNLLFIQEIHDSLKNSFGDLTSLPNRFFNEDTSKITIQNMNAQFVFTFGLLFDGMTSYYSKNLYDIFYSENIYYLPASRSGLYQGLNSFGAIFAELSKNRSAISTDFKIPTLSEAVSDYYLNLSNIETSNENSDFSEYIEEIEGEILHGKVEFDNQSKKMYFTPNNTSLKLDLFTTSSMVAEIAPIVSYLKYVCSTATKEGQKPLIFIEEPEAHLHPETQVKLMRVFARLVKDNKIKLVMTSHSNYIFNAASNLVMDNKIPADKFEAVLFKMTEEGSVAQNMATDEYGIDDDNFIDVAESLYEEKIAIINKLNGY